MVSSSDFTRLGMASTTIGAGAGLLVDSRLVKSYDWCIEWFRPAPLSQVYEVMTSSEVVRQWWSSKKLVNDGEEDELREGSSVSFRVHQAHKVACIAPPFNIRCIYTDVEPARTKAAPGRHWGSEQCAGDPGHECLLGRSRECSPGDKELRLRMSVLTMVEP